MTKKLLVKQGGGAASEVDYATAFTGRKGAPFLDQQTPILQMGQRFANGECAQGYFKVVDPDAELSSTGFRLRPWSEVRLTDDASGDELTLAWMRLSSGDVGRRDVYIGGDEIEHSPGLMDCNLDLRGLPFRTSWERPAETDQQRLGNLKTTKLDGSSSTGSIVRDTTNINISTVASGHLCDFSSPTDLTAKTYPAGTEPLDLIADVAEQSGKIFGVVLHHTGGGTHKCLLYIDQDDLTTYTSDVRISDDVADWDPEDDTAPTFEPHWVQGSGKEVNYEPVVSGILSFYNGSDDDTHAVYVETGEAPEDWETFVGVFNDDQSENLTPATRRATWQLEDRKRPFISNRVSIIVRADQAHLVEAGMAMETKSVVLNSGPDKESFVWRRVAQKTIEPLPDGRYWLHLQLERPRMSHGANGGPGQPKATSPTPAPEFTPDPGDSIEGFFRANDPGSDGLGWDGNLPNQGGTGSGLGANGSDWYYFKSSAPDNYSHTRAWAEGDQMRVEGWCQGTQPGTFRVVFTNLAGGSNGTLVTGGTIVGGPHVLFAPNGAAGWQFFSVGPFTAPAGTTSYAFERTGSSIVFDEVTVYLVDSGTVENDEHAINYGECPHESPHFLPSDYVECKLADLQNQISEVPEGTSESTPETPFHHGDLVRGFNLTKYGVVLNKGTGGDWDASLIESGSVYWDPNEGRYGMVYGGYGAGPDNAAIGLAWSDDLLTWTKEASNPILDESGAGADAAGCTGPFMWYEGGTYYLFYIGMTGTGYEGGTKSLCLATASDPTGTWTRLGAIIEPEASTWRSDQIYHPNIVKRAGIYYLFFNASNGTDENIGYATSTDLLTWTVDDVNSPVLEIGTGWEAHVVGDPYVYRVGETWYMAYFGAPAGFTTHQDGYAFTSDVDFPLGWTKFSGNPVLTVGTAGAFDDAVAGKPGIWMTPTRLYHFYTADGDTTPAGREIALAYEDLPGGGVSDHGALSGLGDDDHTQYVKDTEFGAKGDLLGGTGSGTFDNLGVGTDGQVLTASSGDTTGMTWATPAGSNAIGEILISDTPSTPLIFADLVQNEAQDDLVYADP